MNLVTSSAFCNTPAAGPAAGNRKRADRGAAARKTADRAATVLLWISAAATLGILVYILGFILYRGFRSDNIIESDYINSGTTSISAPFLPVEAVLTANSSLRLKRIDSATLDQMLAGRQSGWGNVNGQDLDAYPYVLEGWDKVPRGKTTSISRTPEELLASVASEQGGFGFIPADMARTAEEAGVRIMEIRPFSVSVNSSVTEIRDNRKLRYLDEKDLQLVMSGRISDWSKTGGTGLKTVIVVPPPGSPEYGAFLKISGLTETAIPDSMIRTASIEEYLAALAETEGAAGITAYWNKPPEGAEILRCRYRETGANLQLWFLTEEPKRAGRVGGISSIIINTLYMLALTILFSAPLGIGAAVYLTEYAKQGRLVGLLRLGTETLSGIPSIIFGLFGYIVFVNGMRLGIGLLSGTLTLTLMILPTITRTAEEALKSVPVSFRAGSLALGAGKWQTIRKVVIPAAAPGIVTGIILAIGRAVGETAALLFTMGFDYRRAENLSTSARVLSTHLYQLVKEGISFDRAFATATILILIILCINMLATKLIKRRF